jgi:hypothetical protein
MKKSDLTMSYPIWVWMYDYGSISYPQAWLKSTKQNQAHPQVHTYAFASEKDALEHPARMGWDKDHKFILGKCYLNI